MKPLPYCSPAMLEMLRAIAAGKIGENEPADKAKEKIYVALKSRGWISRGAITDAGRKYLESQN